MQTFITGMSALELWSKNNIFPETLECCNNFRDCGFDRKTVEKAAVKYRLSYPINIAVPDGAKKTLGTDVKCHRFPSRMPPGSFLKIENDLYAASPELCFVQAAALLPLCSLVELGNNLCGTYYLDDRARFLQQSRRPVATPESLENFISSVEYLNGLRKASQAVKYVLPGSHSPYESKIAAATQLPLALGGFGLPRAELNYNVKLTSKAVEFLRMEMCACDLAWPKVKVALEYDSNLTHLEIGQHVYDKKKATALAESGYTLFTATAEQFRSFGNYEDFFLMLGKKLNKVFHKDSLEKHRELRREVYHILFRSN